MAGGTHQRGSDPVWCVLPTRRSPHGDVRPGRRPPGREPGLRHRDRRVAGRGSARMVRRGRQPAAGSHDVQQPGDLRRLASGARLATVCSGAMSLQRMDNVLIVVEDIEAAKAFFAELGMELEGETTVEGPWVDGTVGLDDVRADIAMMRTPDGHGRVELTRFHRPPAVRAEPENAPANTLGIRRIMFAVDDIDDVVTRLGRHGG